MNTVVRLSSLLFVGFCLSFGMAHAAPTVGKTAPDFKLPDTAGKTHQLSSYKGKYVVLEWLNHDCPFVKKHYNSGNMQKVQRLALKKGVVWFSIVSSAPGRQGHNSPKDTDALAKKKKASPSAVLLDPSGTVGRLYGAKTTPHMFVIDPKGNVIYMGAIDDKPSTDVDDVKSANNFVLAALKQAMSGKTVQKPITAPYGCSVKYKN